MRIKRYVSKNGVNTCPPILEYKIINAPKFSALMTPFRNYFPQLGNQSPNLKNLGPILLQIPRISQPLSQTSPLYAPIGNITIRENCRWTDQAILYSEISPKSWPLAVKSPAQSLDYRANSYHIHLNTLRFHGCGKEISQICPCPFCFINTSFSGTPSPSYHSTAQNLLFWRRHCLRAPSSLLHQSSKSSILFLAKKWPSTSSFLRSVYHAFSFRTFAVLLFICDSFYWVPFFFLLFFHPQNFLGFGR